MPRERRPRWWLRILSVIAVLALLGGAAEVALRLILPGVVAGIVREQLQLSDDHPVEVELGGSALFGAVRGGMDDTRIEVPNAPVIDGVTVDASAHADFLPFAADTQPMRGGTVRLTVQPEQLSGLVSVLTQGIAQTGEISDGAITVGRDAEFFGQQVRIAATLGVSVVDGDVRIEPRGVNAAGFDLSADQIASATGGLLDPILQPQTVCVRDRIPVGITLTGITLSTTGAASLDASLSPGILSDAKQLENGTCA